MAMKHPFDDPFSREAVISLRTEIRHDHDEEREYVLDLNFKIVAEWWRSDDFETRFETEAGSVHLRLVRMGVAIEDGAILSDLFDLDQSMSGLSHLYDWHDPNLEFIPAVMEVCKVANSFSDLFSLESIELLPWARRQGVGLRVIDLLLRHWQSGCSLALVEPVPWWADEAEVEVGTKKLTRYFAQLGFKPVSGLPYLVRPIEMSPPNLTEVDLPDRLLVPSGLGKEVEETGPVP